MIPKKTVWGVTDGSQGMVSQVTGLARSMASLMDLNYEIKTVNIRFPWHILPTGCFPCPTFAIKNQIAFNPPPDYLITCGKRSVYLSLSLKTRLKDKIFTIHIQNPKTNLERFDLVIAPCHDHLSGNNVIHSTLAINHINDDLIAQEALQFEHDFGTVNKPICTVLIGGKSRNYRFETPQVDALIKKLTTLMARHDFYFVILFSRRTPLFIKEKLQLAFANEITVWTDETRNPYLALLGFSSFIICTSDSVSMISEAIYSKKPTYIFRLPSLKKNNRMEKFISNLLLNNLTKILYDRLEKFDANFISNETDIIANKILEHSHVSLSRNR